jgi:hypothetical protein
LFLGTKVFEIDSLRPASLLGTGQPLRAYGDPVHGTEAYSNALKKVILEAIEQFDYSYAEDSQAAATGKYCMVIG